MLRLFLSAAATAMLVSISVFADEIKPAVVYDTGGKNDHSFNEGVYNGAEKFKKDTGIDYAEFEVMNDSQREQAMRNFARKGLSPIVVVGFSQAAALEKVADEFPDIKFAIIDKIVGKPNVSSIIFKENEGSYLVGVLAAMASKTGKVGFIGGMDIPFIRRFSCGYVGGVKSVNKDAEVFINMVGTTGAAWNDPVKGGELAKSQFDRGADVIYHAAGSTGVGVLQAAADADKLGIGVDSNQNGLHPGKILTSMTKGVDVAAYKTFEDAKNGTFKPGTVTLGLAEGGVGWALDDNNRALITPEMMDAVKKAEDDIKSGKIEVHNYMTDNACPY
jgi:basic membrane protein A